MEPMKRTLLTMAALLALAAHGPARAEEGTSLGRVRSQMNAGTWDGIVLIKGRPKAAPAPASAASAAAAAASTGTTAATAATAATTAAATAAAVAPGQSSPSAAQGPSVFERMRALLGGDEPLSGERLNDAKRLRSPSQGIPLPTAATAARAASAASTPRP